MEFRLLGYLPNLEELDLSGTGVKTVDLSKVVQVQTLQRILLVGCQQLRSKTLGIYLLGDSNTKCTHLGGVHSIGCDFETNKFSSLSFVVSRGVNTLRGCFS